MAGKPFEVDMLPYAAVSSILWHTHQTNKQIRRHDCYEIYVIINLFPTSEPPGMGAIAKQSVIERASLHDVFVFPTCPPQAYQHAPTCFTTTANDSLDGKSSFSLLLFTLRHLSL